MERLFPFKVSKEKKDVATALQVFEMLWHNHERRGGALSTKQLSTVFHKYISDAVTYDGGWRRGKYWSRQAWERACKQGSTGKIGLKCEHVVPRAAVLTHAMQLDTVEQAKAFVVDASFVCVITKEENARLDAAGLTSSHPNVEDPWLRYSTLREPIQVLNVPGFLSEEEQAILRRHHILVEIGSLPCMP